MKNVINRALVAKKKITLFLTALLMASAGLWANNITYTATSVLLTIDGSFNLPIYNHTYVPETGKGKLTFDGDVTSLGENSLKGCSNLTSIDLPNSVTTIGESAFEGCSGLTSITLPNSVTTIGESAFEGCSGLTTITLPNSVTTIKRNTFNGCTNLRSITLPNTLTTIEQMAFYDCYWLASITIPSSVTEIEGDAFSACMLLNTVTFEGNACQNAIANDAFRATSSTEDHLTLILPEDWDYDAAPTDNATAWHGGYFVSNIYSSDEATDKQAAITAISVIMRDYSESAYLQSLLTEETAKINSATNRLALNTIKQAAIEKMQTAVNAFATGLSVGLTAAEAELHGSMATEAAGHAVVVTDGETTVTLYNPTSVSFEKLTK